MKKKLLTITLTTMGMLSLFLMLIVACKKKVVPDTPTGVSAANMGTYIRISWKAASNAEYYWITDNSGNTIGETSGLYYDDYNPKVGNNYYYVYSKNSYYTSLYAELVSCYYSGNNGGGGENNSPSAPTGVSANVNGTSIQVSWNSVSGASSYRVYRASSGSGPYSQIGTSGSTYYNDNNPMTNNYYKVTAIGSDGSESEKSSYAYCQYSGGGGGGGTAPSAPTGVSATISGSRIKVSWNSVPDADTYYVYRSWNNVDYGIYKATTYTYIYDDNPDEDNYYKVTSVGSNGSESEMSSYAYCQYSGGGGGNTAPSVPTGVSATVNGSRIIVSWNSVSDADEYMVYRSNNGSSYTNIGSTSNAYIYDNNPNEDNYYKVKAKNSYGESSFSSSVYCHYSSGGGGGGTAPSAPAGVSAVVSGSKIKVSWNSVSDADEYIVYWSSNGSSYSSIGTTSNAYFYDNNPSEDNYYKVKAKNSYGESSFSSYAYCHYTSGGGGGSNYSPCPPSVTVTGSSTSLTVKWTATTGISCGTPTSYKVYKRNPFTGDLELLTTTSSTSYKDNNVHPGINRYAVNAINNNGTAANYANSSSIPLSKPSSFTAQKSGSDYVKFTWSKVSKAEGYQIFQSSSANGTYYILDEIDDVNTTTLTRYFPGESGHTYYFKIRAYYRASYAGDPIYSDFTTYKSVTF
jgi:fibronectin type 3 domain-containing protein